MSRITCLLALLAAVGCGSAAAPNPPGENPGDPAVGDVDQASGGALDLGAADLASGDLALSPWKLTWSDEFDGPAGGAIDGAKWKFDVGTGQNGWGNGELQYYTNRTSNVALDGNGALQIIARKEAFMNSAYTSGRINTAGKFAQAYGRFEARIQIAQGQGIWPAFWVLGDNIGTAGWPGCGELDIQETVGPLPPKNHGSAHGPGYSGGNPLTATSPALATGALSDGYHVYAIEWEPNKVQWYVDDKLYETRTPADVPAGATWVYDHPFFVILNLAVGGSFPGPPDGTTVFPQITKVDYVRVYAKR